MTRCPAGTRYNEKYWKKCEPQPERFRKLIDKALAHAMDCEFVIEKDGNKAILLFTQHPNYHTAIYPTIKVYDYDSQKSQEQADKIDNELEIKNRNSFDEGTVYGSFAVCEDSDCAIDQLHSFLYWGFGIRHKRANEED
jgi:hypothetical protein